MNSVDVIHKFDERAGNSVAFGRIQSKVSNSDHFRVSQAPLDLRSVEKKKENPGIEQPGSRALTWPELTHTHTSTGPLLVKRRIKKPTKKTKRINLSNSDETRKNPIRFAADGPRVPLVGNSHVTRPYRTALIPFIGRPERLVRVSRFAVCVLLLFFFCFFLHRISLAQAAVECNCTRELWNEKKLQQPKNTVRSSWGFTVITCGVCDPPRPWFDFTAEEQQQKKKRRNPARNIQRIFPSSCARSIRRSSFNGAPQQHASVIVRFSGLFFLQFSTNRVLANWIRFAVLGQVRMMRRRVHFWRCHPVFSWPNFSFFVRTRVCVCFLIKSKFFPTSEVDASQPLTESAKVNS